MKPPKSLPIRISLFVILILIINLWSLHHLGKELTCFLITNGPLLLIAIVRFLWDFLRTHEQIELKARFQNVFVLLLSTPILFALYCLFAVVGCFVSSVSVMAGGVTTNMTVDLFPEGQQQSRQIPEILNDSNKAVRFIRWTNPFGRSFYLDVKGYHRYSFNLYPWTGKKIRVGRDLTISPSFIIRVPYEIHLLLEVGKVEVVSGNDTIADVNTAPERGSIIVGPDRSIPLSFIEKWKMELGAVKGESPTAFGAALQAWCDPIVVKPSKKIAPGMKLEAKFIAKAENTTEARVRFTVSHEIIQDVLLISEE